MNTLKTAAVAAVVAALLLLGLVAYNVFRTPAAATGPIEAIPLAAASASADSVAEASPSAEATATSTAAAEASAASSPAADEATETSAAAATESQADMDAILAQIVPSESEARFVIDEVLNNAPKTVVGTTDQVAGELSVDPDDPSATRVGVIQINARTLTTDSNFRNRAIQNQILQTDDYEYITFTPTSIVGLPEQTTVGESYTFQIVGDLTIRDVTQQVTFDVTATPESESRLVGSASTTINYADWGITIPSVRQVASVDEDVRLEIDFVAAPV